MCAYVTVLYSTCSAMTSHSGSAPLLPANATVRLHRRSTTPMPRESLWAAVLADLTAFYSTVIRKLQPRARGAP